MSLQRDYECYLEVYAVLVSGPGALNLNGPAAAVADRALVVAIAASDAKFNLRPRTSEAFKAALKRMLEGKAQHLDGDRTRKFSLDLSL